jgi:DNA-binding helix-hairpin-helix protein with protein kinase domain
MTKVSRDARIRDMQRGDSVDKRAAELMKKDEKLGQGRAQVMAYKELVAEQAKRDTEANKKN